MWRAGRLPPVDGAEQTASVAWVLASTRQSLAPGTYTACGLPSNGVMRSPSTPKSRPPALIFALPETSTRHASRSPVAADALSPAASLCTSKPTCFQPALCGVMLITLPRSGRGFTWSLDMPALFPCRNEILEPCRHVGYRFRVRDLAGEPRVRGAGKDGAPHGEAFDQRAAGSHAECADQLAFGGLQPEEHDAAAVGVARIHGPLYGAPRRGALLRLEFPPVRLDAERVQAREHRGHRGLVERPVPAGDDLDQQLAAGGARRIVHPHELALLARLGLLVIVGVVEAQAFDGVRDRPFREVQRLEVERARAGLLHGPPDPEAGFRRLVQRLLAIGRVEQHAKAGATLRDAQCRVHGEHFELVDTGARRAVPVGDGLEVRAMVDGERHQA